MLHASSPSSNPKCACYTMQTCLGMYWSLGITLSSQILPLWISLQLACTSWLVGMRGLRLLLAFPPPQGPTQHTRTFLNEYQKRDQKFDQIWWRRHHCYTQFCNVTLYGQAVTKPLQYAVTNRFAVFVTNKGCSVLSWTALQSSLFVLYMCDAECGCMPKN